jgi:SAM-dependent methyltransferase
MKSKDLEDFKKILSAAFYDESSWQIVEGPMPDDLDRAGVAGRVAGQVKKAIIRALRRRGYVLMRPQPFDVALREGGLDWPFFGYTMIGHKRLNNIQHAVETVLNENIPGDFIETGVWRGGAVMLMKAVLDAHGVTDRTVWCADSFEGLPPPNEKDKALAATADFSDRMILAVSKEQVEANFRRFELLDDRVKFLKGWFSDTLPNAPVKDLAILRLDGDLYESTMDALVNLYPKLRPGGFLIIDDYSSWAGCKQAITDYRESHGIAAEIQMIDSHAAFWRVPR